MGFERFRKHWIAALFFTVFALHFPGSALAQDAENAVPTLVNFGGTLTDLNGHPLHGVVGVTFLLYKEQNSLTPLWLETQNVLADDGGHYTVMLGATKSNGLPTDLFASGEARWLGVQAEGQAEQPRALLLSVPYALKAGDAQTLGGLPASAFMQTKTQTAGRTEKSAQSVAANSTAKNSLPANPTVTGSGVANFIPMWDSKSDIVDSILFQKSSQIGVNTTSPLATLDVNGKALIRDSLVLLPKSTDNTLAVNGTNFKIDSTGKVTFIAGQTFPGTGTITGVTTGAGSGLTGGGTSGTLNVSVASAGVTNAMLQHPSLTVSAGTGLTGGGAVSLGGTTTLNVNTSLIPQLNAANTFSQPVTINGNTSSVAALNATNTNGNGIYADAPGPSGNGVFGQFSTASQYSSGGSRVGVWGDSSSGAGVYGTTDSNIGVLGAADTGIAVFAQSNSSAVFAQSFGSMGVQAYSTNYVGTYSQMQNASTTGSGFSLAGVWGDSGWPGSFGVLGTTDDGNSFWGKNNTVNHETLYVENDSGPSNGHLPLAARFAGPGSATWCEIYMDAVNNSVGDLLCTGTKSAAVPVDGNRMVRLYAMEAAENWFEDAGAGQLANGKATVQLEPMFAQTVSGDVDYHVFLTPNGECEGLYVASKGAGQFEVRELHGGRSNVSFDYRIMARRKGYENVRLEDVTSHFELAKRNARELEQKIEAARATHKDPRQRPAVPILKGGRAMQTVARPISPRTAGNQ